MEPPDHTHEKALRLAQYEQLKTEQRGRMWAREYCIIFTFTALGGAMGISLSSGTSAAAYILLAVPMVCYALGWTSLRNNDKIMLIGRYIRENYSECTWESYRINAAGRRRKKIIHLSVNLIVFGLSGFIALIMFWTAPNGHGWLINIVSCAESIPLSILIAEFIRSSDIRYNVSQGGA